MIEKDYDTGIYSVYCDAKKCKEESEYDTFENWHDLLRKMKKDGWSSYKIGGMWKNLCKDCGKLVNPKRKVKT